MQWWPGAKDDTLSGANTASGVFGMQPARCLPLALYGPYTPYGYPPSLAPLGLSPRGALPAMPGMAFCSTPRRVHRGRVQKHKIGTTILKNSEGKFVLFIRETCPIGMKSV